MSISQFSDVLGDLCAAADIALRDRHGAGRVWSHAVAHGNIIVHRDPGAYIDVENALVVGPGLQGRARNSVVVSVGRDRSGGELRAIDSTVVGPNVRVNASGRTAVHGRNASVRVKHQRDRATVTLSGQKKKVAKQIQSTPRAIKSSSRSTSSKKKKQKSRRQQQRRSEDRHAA